MDQHIGLGNGGPLDGVKISSGLTWTGFVRSDDSGRYVWNPTQSRWDWKPRTATSLIFADEPVRRKPKKTTTNKKTGSAKKVTQQKSTETDKESA